MSTGLSRFGFHLWVLLLELDPQIILSDGSGDPFDEHQLASCGVPEQKD